MQAAALEKEQKQTDDLDFFHFKAFFKFIIQLAQSKEARKKYPLLLLLSDKLFICLRTTFNREEKNPNTNYHKALAEDLKRLQAEGILLRAFQKFFPNQKKQTLDRIILEIIQDAENNFNKLVALMKASNVTGQKFIQDLIPVTKKLQSGLSTAYERYSVRTGRNYNPTKLKEYDALQTANVALATDNYLLAIAVLRQEIHDLAQKIIYIKKNKNEIENNKTIIQDLEDLQKDCIRLLALAYNNYGAHVNKNNFDIDLAIELYKDAIRWIYSIANDFTEQDRNNWKTYGDNLTWTEKLKNSLDSSCDESSFGEASVPSSTNVTSDDSELKQHRQLKHLKTQYELLFAECDEAATFLVDNNMEQAAIKLLQALMTAYEILFVRHEAEKILKLLIKLLNGCIDYFKKNKRYSDIIDIANASIITLNAVPEHCRTNDHLPLLATQQFHLLQSLQVVAHQAFYDRKVAFFKEKLDAALQLLDNNVFRLLTDSQEQYFAYQLMLKIADLCFGYAYHDAKKPNDAIQYYQKAIAIVESVPDKFKYESDEKKKREYLFNRSEEHAEVAKSFNDPKKAIEYYEKATAIFDNTPDQFIPYSDKKDLCDYIRNLAKMYYKAAICYFEQDGKDETIKRLIKARTLITQITGSLRNDSDDVDLKIYEAELAKLQPGYVPMEHDVLGHVYLASHTRVFAVESKNSQDSSTKTTEQVQKCCVIL